MTDNAIAAHYTALTSLAPKILLIEDDPFLVRFYRARFRQNGFEAISIEDGELANQAAIDEKPDAIVLDIILPNKSGFEILKDLKENPATKDIPVITLTQLSQKADEEKLIALGSSKHMVKMGANLDEVIAVIKELTA